VSNLPLILVFDNNTISEMDCEPSRTANDVIDLTVDEGEEDLSKALQLSLEESNKQSNLTTFKPSDREPSVHWAMVPSNVRCD
jgi:hypothetical protein